jgi:hypothetical protein
MESFKNLRPEIAKITVDELVHEATKCPNSFVQDMSKNIADYCVRSFYKGYDFAQHNMDCIIDELNDYYRHMSDSNKNKEFFEYIITKYKNQNQL